jgi:hypothetical protein
MMDRQVAYLDEQLSSVSPDQLVEFQAHFEELVRSANRWDLWAVAYIIAGGCSDEWFDYFRYWLVSLGQRGYERALENPASVDELLSETNAEDIFFESISYVASAAYRRRTGSEIPLLALEPVAPVGEPWSIDEDLASRFPTLWAKYGS